MGFFKSIGNLAKKVAPVVVGGLTGGWGAAALGGLSLLKGSKDQGKADALNKQQLDLANQRWQQGAPLRSVGMEGLLSQKRPDLSAQFGGTSNPFARPAVGAMPPQMPPQMPPEGPPSGLGGPGLPQGGGMPPRGVKSVGDRRMY